MSGAWNLNPWLVQVETVPLTEIPIGYVGVGGTRVMGATLDESLHELEVPAVYDLHNEVPMPAQNIATNYSRIASDLLHGTHLSPTFAEAVELHRLINAIRNTGSTP